MAKVKRVPAKVHQVAQLASRIGFVWRHYYGEIFDVLVKEDTDSSAYTALALPPHTDLPSRARQPGYQLLHCIANNSTGGDFILIDGWKVATRLRRESPELYHILSTVPVEFRFVSQTVDYQCAGTIFEHNSRGQLSAIRFNSFLQSPLRLDFTTTHKFYVAYRRFLSLVSDPAAQIRHKWCAGDLICLDNWRTLHARSPFDSTTGIRHLQGCYLDRDEMDSRMRVLQRRVQLER
jgi:gamma-butyrobetaine dioxygenase